MRYLLVVAMLLSSNVFAELYKDYEPSEQFIQLTVVAVEPNYLDNYIVNLKQFKYKAVVSIWLPCNFRSSCS